ncbi:MAG: DUF3579 domain-containing protein [Betaproteobacteria bacterium AqS2]|uniref:DUF3579 domain-containing protein n=1 Tax=Candidatus Amphirhobacter heronislandensis TaxID=1732024 RepID=A0A930UDX0_9GAMM|nr:DUF3579 domain-containing protein [Betaproteobacteria bacterium AqS2]
MADQDTGGLKPSGKPPDYILIKGVTKDDRKFRPSDWVDRLMGSISIYAKEEDAERHDDIIECMCMTERDGFRGIVLSHQIESLAPQIHRFVLNFANDNNLQVVALEDAEWNDERQQVVAKPKRAFS